MKLQIFEDEYSVCQLPPDQAIPEWAAINNDPFVSISLTQDELTAIVRSKHVPENPLTGMKIQSGFACLRVVGDLEFDVIGVIAGISSVLAEQKIPILSISTYNTDYFLIPKSESDQAVSALEKAGYEFEAP